MSSSFDFEHASSLLPEAERRVISGPAVKSLKGGEKLTLRILPGWHTPQVWYRAFFRHYMFGLESLTIGRVRRPFLCLQRCFGEPCFFCDLSEALCASSSEEDQALGDKIFPWSACLVNAYRVHAEEPEVEVYSLSNTTMKNLVSIWKEGINFMDPVNGCPVVFKPVPGTKFFMPEVDLQKKGPVPEAFLKGLNDLDDVLQRLKVSYLQVAANFSPSVVRIVLSYYKRKGVKPPDGLESLAGESMLSTAGASTPSVSEQKSVSYGFNESTYQDLGFSADSPAPVPDQAQPHQVQPHQAQPAPVPDQAQPDPTLEPGVDPGSESGATESDQLLDQQMAEIEKALGEIL